MGSYPGVPWYCGGSNVDDLDGFIERGVPAGDVYGTVPSPLDLMDGAMRVYDQIVRGEQGGLPVRRLPEGLRVG